MKISVCLFSLLFSVSGAHSQDIKCAAVYETLPWAMELNEKAITRDSLLIYYYRDLVCYKLPYFFTSNTLSDDEYGDPKTAISLTRVQYRYFVMNRNDSDGYVFDDIFTQYERWHSFDSIIMQNSILSNRKKLYEQMLPYLLTSVQTTTVIPGGMVKVYKAHYPGDTASRISFHLEFSDAVSKNFFSLCPQLDSVSGRKLIKSSILVANECLKDYGMLDGAFELYNQELKEIPVKDGETIHGFFERFRDIRSAKKTRKTDKD